MIVQQTFLIWNMCRLHFEDPTFLIMLSLCDSPISMYFPNTHWKMRLLREVTSYIALPGTSYTCLHAQKCKDSLHVTWSNLTSHQQVFWSQPSWMSVTAVIHFIWCIACMPCLWPAFNVNGLAQDYSNSIANALKLLQACTKPSM